MNEDQKEVRHAVEGARKPHHPQASSSDVLPREELGVLLKEIRSLTHRCEIALAIDDQQESSIDGLPVVELLMELRLEMGRIIDPWKIALRHVHEDASPLRPLKILQELEVLLSDICRAIRWNIALKDEGQEALSSGGRQMTLELVVALNPIRSIALKVNRASASSFVMLQVLQEIGVLFKGICSIVHRITIALLHDLGQASSLGAQEILEEFEGLLKDISSNAGGCEKALEPDAQPVRSLRARRIEEGKRTDDAIRGARKKTLWDALAEEDYGLAEKLIAEGTDINTTDRDGNTPLHKSLMNRNVFVLPGKSLQNAPTLREILKEHPQNREPPVPVSLAVAFFLASKGANLELKNNSGVAPYQLVRSTEEFKQLVFWSRKNGDFIQRSTRSTEVSHQPAKKVEAVSERTEQAPKCRSCKKQQSRIAFPCGHDACFSCAESLIACYICGAIILGRTATFETAKQKIRELHAS